MKVQIAFPKIRALSAPLALAALLGLSACGDAPRETPVTAAPEPAAALAIQARIGPDSTAVSAVLTTRDVGDARARIGGTLDRVLVREGDDVRRGQLLAIVVDQRLLLEARAGAAGV
ncbi:MAG: biotin/lipoyl-binding protein, partial [Burkholderiales bacterium]|nr:biotin/lipoyl-binding protein [Burkholderiales bacterium]